MRHADRWLALLRIAIGFWLLKGGLRKVALGWWGIIPLPTVTERWVSFMPKRVTEFAAGNGIEWVRSFLTDVVLPNSPLFAFLTAWGEFGIGLGLTLGALVPLSSAMGIVMIGSYFLANYWMGFCQQWLHYALLAVLVVFFATRAGRTFGLDSWVLKRFPDRPLVRFLC